MSLHGWKRYLILCLTAMLAVSGCASLGIGGEPEPTPIPFNRFNAQNVFDAFSRAGLQVQNLQRDMLIGRDAPSTFSDRYIFEIERIAPSGGQILIFSTPDDMHAWQTYIDTLRANANTRRDVIFVYTYGNVMLQMNANLFPNEADAFRTALFTME